jgi:CHAT domain-containing protein
VLAELHGLLWAPLSEHLAESRLVVVPHGPLHAIPFHAIGPAGRPLLLDHEIVQTPSTALWLRARRRRRTASRRGAVVLGVPDASAPLIADEARSVAACHARSTLLVGSDASRAALLRLGRRAAVLHIACHAEFRADDPGLSSLRLADGSLTIADLNDAALGADLVVLSGCSTGRSSVTEGDDLFGLPRAFLRAGARALVTSLWPVSDASASSWMTTFHTALAAGRSPAAAAHDASISTRDAFPHPHHWAPFCIVGDGGP